MSAGENEEGAAKEEGKEGLLTTIKMGDGRKDEKREREQAAEIKGCRLTPITAITEQLLLGVVVGFSFSSVG